jgi:hypothetical protein
MVDTPGRLPTSWVFAVEVVVSYKDDDGRSILLLQPIAEGSDGSVWRCFVTDRSGVPLPWTRRQTVLDACANSGAWLSYNSATSTWSFDPWLAQRLLLDVLSEPAQHAIHPIAAAA